MKPKMKFNLLDRIYRINNDGKKMSIKKNKRQYQNKMFSNFFSLTAEN